MVPKRMEIIMIAQNNLIGITGVVFLVNMFFLNTNLRVYVNMLKCKYKYILKILSLRRDRVETTFKFDIKDQCRNSGGTVLQLCVALNWGGGKHKKYNVRFVRCENVLKCTKIPY